MDGWREGGRQAGTSAGHALAGNVLGGEEGVAREHAHRYPRPLARSHLLRERERERARERQQVTSPWGRCERDSRPLARSHLRSVQCFGFRV